MTKEELIARLEGMIETWEVLGDVLPNPGNIQAIKIALAAIEQVDAEHGNVTELAE